MQNTPKLKKALCHGTPSFLELEKALNEWILDHRSSGYVCNIFACNKTSEVKNVLYQKEGSEQFYQKQFLLIGRLVHIVHEMQWSVLHQCTKITQKVPQYLEEKIMQFQKCVIQK